MISTISLRMDQGELTVISSPSSWPVSNVRPFFPSLTSSPRHANRFARTGTPHPNISTIFMGRSRPLELVCRLTPRSAQPRRDG